MPERAGELRGRLAVELEAAAARRAARRVLAALPRSHRPPPHGAPAARDLRPSSSAAKIAACTSASTVRRTALSTASRASSCRNRRRRGRRAALPTRGSGRAAPSSSGATRFEQPELGAQPGSRRRPPAAGAHRRQPRRPREHGVTHRLGQVAAAGGEDLGDVEGVPLREPVDRVGVRAVAAPRARGTASGESRGTDSLDTACAEVSSPSTTRRGWSPATSSSR